ncbi:MAG: cytochrome [Betaproteobacteria bacterium]|nr:cytochrome [Betaproteobacteria bacterium]
MSRLTEFLHGGLRVCASGCTALLFSVAPPAHAASENVAQVGDWKGIGRAATPAEVRAWDIDVRPDFKGLPKGAGTVARGQEIWESKCATCHGVFGEATHVFTPIAGGVHSEDLKAGHTASLLKPTEARTTVMKLSHVSTLWDYINRAMPWNAPRSLSIDEVYAVTAYVLNLGSVLPDDFTLSNENVAEVQARLPNRDGMTMDHGMWSVKGKPDVRNVACMKGCAVDVKVASVLPEAARPAHGNLADQNRTIGPVRGVVTAAQVAGTAPAVPSQGVAMLQLANKGACLSCHQIETKVVGPAFREVAAKYKGDPKAFATLIAKVKNGGQGIWGAIPMPPAQSLSDEEIGKLVRWVLDGTPQ